MDGATPKTLDILIATIDDRIAPTEHVLVDAPGVRHVVVHQMTRVAAPATLASVGRVRTMANVQYVGVVREQGLARARNRALDRASAPFCLLADDDVRLDVGAHEIIDEAFRRWPEADVITFRRRDGAAAKSGAGYRWHTARSILGLDQVDIVVRREAIRRKALRFDEEFGHGARFPADDRRILLMDALRANLDILDAPDALAAVKAETSTHATAVASGAALARMLGPTALPIQVVRAVAERSRAAGTTIARLRSSAAGLAGALRYLRKR